MSWLQYAFRILYLPIGIFGVAVGTVATTGLARARRRRRHRRACATTLRRALRAARVPDACPRPSGLIVLAHADRAPALRARAASTPPTPQHTATALALYSIGLVAYTGVKVLAPAFYALGTPRVPLLASACRRGRRTWW